LTRLGKGLLKHSTSLYHITQCVCSLWPELYPIDSANPLQLCIMHASTQERFKHSIPSRRTIDRFHPPYPPPADLPEFAFDPGNCRINITFRFFRPDFHPDTIPRCKCGEMTGLRPDMKGRQRGSVVEGVASDKGVSRRPDSSLGGERATGYWWTCTAGDQNEGKGCGFWKVMDVKAEGRGPFVSDVSSRLEI
jgi:hypothetical protein